LTYHLADGRVVLRDYLGDIGEGLTRDTPSHLGRLGRDLALPWGLCWI